jgi:hypothetical protein
MGALRFAVLCGLAATAAALGADARVLAEQESEIPIPWAPDHEQAGVAIAGSKVALFQSFGNDTILQYELGARGLELSKRLSTGTWENRTLEIAYRGKVAVSAGGDAVVWRRDVRDEEENDKMALIIFICPPDDPPDQPTTVPTLQLTTAPTPFTPFPTRQPTVKPKRCLQAERIPASASFTGELLSLGSDMEGPDAIVSFEPSCRSIKRYAGNGSCVVRFDRAVGVFLVAELPAVSAGWAGATVPKSVSLRGSTIAFATEDSSIFVRSAAGVLTRVPHEGLGGGKVRQLVLIGDNMLAALVGDQVFIFANARLGGSFKQVQVIGNKEARISEIRASDTKLAVAFLRDDGAYLELFDKSAADGKWTTEKAFSNGWGWRDHPGRVSPPIMFDLDGDRIVYLTNRPGENVMRTYQGRRNATAPPTGLSVAAIAGIAGGSVAGLILIALIAVAMRARAEPAQGEAVMTCRSDGSAPSRPLSISSTARAKWHARHIEPSVPPTL